MKNKAISALIYIVSNKCLIIVKKIHLEKIFKLMEILTNPNLFVILLKRITIYFQKINF